eukprot:CAMPEP_0173410626 /NCGR_PEP_ID=MMETSP1356-20130122/75036_1 /TAXON_ID=77927 ORGANISM="Hemiselmis virescens, Strain PCC157" /NCGR_SAMPLE_ID=MMETSP1356 /ASSEMBLY_ACC=CAM_ASM_000847 /LENGTH=92 /DNA_ID=CAMNT_0014372265 /DNA_START=213 /DNA_END=487 /DNA_ORIENTATION=+
MSSTVGAKALPTKNVNLIAQQLVVLCVRDAVLVLALGAVGAPPLREEHAKPLPARCRHSPPCIAAGIEAGGCLQRLLGVPSELLAVPDVEVP